MRRSWYGVSNQPTSWILQTISPFVVPSCHHSITFQLSWKSASCAYETLLCPHRKEKSLRDVVRKCLTRVRALQSSVVQITYLSVSLRYSNTRSRTATIQTPDAAEFRVPSGSAMRLTRGHAGTTAYRVERRQSRELVLDQFVSRHIEELHG